ncbi:Uu.00g045150.m01.CDS01 [Anthostomella pinea]|uniref:Uu.00g045150.m01.CDS01 n=1 Tax=Anthostomella pinea TaxID=933095 RepID=A0AAI8YEE1_9PEZI|nr:Uu.00g045150.m01.CDS01 [Anthostomella pinea]
MFYAWFQTIPDRSMTVERWSQDLEDYVNVLYHDQWKNSNPLQEAPGIMENYKEDLLFSMERLSQNPYPLRQVKANEELPFKVDDDLVKNIAGDSLKDLQKDGKLFVVDHKYQADLEKTTYEPKRYGAACTAYFLIDHSGKFLPLAIKTNAGSDLIYTPKD